MPSFGTSRQFASGSAGIPRTDTVLRRPEGTTTFADSGTSPPPLSMDKLALAKTLFTPSLATALVLIFGGCCSNVYALESITHRVPKCGMLITFAQFLGVTIGGFLQFSLSHTGRQAIWEHKVPLPEYMKIVAFHFSVAVLNNMALAYKISVPVHIMLRSGGSMVTLLLAWVFFGRKYTPRQVAAVALLTCGVIISTTSGDSASSHTDAPAAYGGFALGVSSMILAQLMASAMGLYLERTFRKYGPSWRETLFFTHILALPFFIPFATKIWSELRVLLDSEPLFTNPEILKYSVLPFNPPILIVYLFLNVFTQLLCVSGVNQLASSSTALSVSIVLNLRKFISLALSFCVFGHRIDTGIVVGATFVFIGAGWYSQESTHKARLGSKKSDVDLTKLNGGDSVSTRNRPEPNMTPNIEKGAF